jgi:hypothetical protein
MAIITHQEPGLRRRVKVSPSFDTVRGVINFRLCPLVEIPDGQGGWKQIEESALKPATDFLIQPTDRIDLASGRLYPEGDPETPESAIPMYQVMTTGTGRDIGMTSLDEPVYEAMATFNEKIVIANGAVIPFTPPAEGDTILSGQDDF